MVKQTIRIFCRVKPTNHPTGLYEIDDENTQDSQDSMISFFMPKDIADGYVNNKKENYKFSFNQIFDQQTKQDVIFQNVAEPVINNVISGFNGTIFAYGQTGSGKTFTITGGAERYVDRGIIPRTLSYIFEKSAENANLIYTIHVSYLEIYNESGYDLLDPKHEASKLEDLPKVSLLEDNDGNIHLKNLSMHQATNEEEALNLLFLGDTNRMIAETPMNQASTRSHCIFTIHVSVRETDSATIRRSKLHLVDLAGSERVSKTGVGGTLLKEAKYINLSLHHLELVIIALSEKSRSHIPYRTSMMTSVLRDSLGGNCMTSMIATCSVEKKNVDESISTCRFAQRVALIKNDATMNEELDPQLMIAKLKREIQQLKDELSLLKGEQYEDELDEREKEKLKELVRSFVDDPDKETLLSVGADMRKINYCFLLLKTYRINSAQGSDQKTIKSPESSRDAPRSIPEQQLSLNSSYLSNTTEIQKLKDIILQRDNEINILVGMLKKEKKRAEQMTHPGETVVDRKAGSSDSLRVIQQHNKNNHNRSSTPEDEERQRNGYTQEKPGKNAGNALLRNLNHKNKASMSVGRQEAFESFVRDYPDNELIEENKKGLRARYSEAKKLGEQVNQARQAINSLKGKLEKLKIRRSLQVAAGASIKLEEEDEEENSLRKNLDEEKQNYKSSFNQLKALKTEIEHMQFLLEKSKVKLQKDFEVWWAEQVVSMENNNTQHFKKSEIKSAWKTPPLTPSTALTSSSHQYRNDGDQSTSRNSRNHHTSSRSDRSVSSELRQSSASLSSSRNAFLKNISNKKTNVSILSSTPDGRSSSSSIRLTGDAKTDEDIMAFMKARQELMRKSRK